jgi:branched-chain amino acid transport system permease protein
MKPAARALLLYAVMAGLIVGVGLVQGWTVGLTILNLCLISAVMALGVNIQWGYAGLFNAGVMGFAALGGVGVVLTSMPPVKGALSAGGANLGLAALFIVLTLAAALFVRERVPAYLRGPVGLLTVLVGYLLMRIFLDPASEAIEAIDPASAGYLGGLGLPVLIGWGVGALFAAGAAYLVGKVALGLRSDYLAIATLGIAESVLAILKN